MIRYDSGNNLAVRKKIFKFFYNLSISFLILFAASRRVGIDRDSVAYFNAAKSQNFDYRWIEPTFGIISFLNNSLFNSSSFIFFLIYSFLGLYTKFRAFPKLTENIFMTLFLYTSSFYFLLEFTQIRVSVSIGFFLLGLVDIFNSNKKGFLIKLFWATLFHYSAVLFLPVILFDREKINSKVWFLLPLFSFFVSKIFHPALLVNLLPQILSSRVNVYLQEIQTPPLFSPYRLLLLGVFFIFFITYDKIHDIRKVLYFKIFSLSISVYYLFLEFGDVFSVRLSGMYSVIIVLVIPLIAKVYRPKIISNLIAFLFMMISLYYTLFINKLLDLGL